ncbi:T9SS type A sorting domain-containing protein [Lunatimonas salinarum]|uniref:T9SS type A sorting domain-containing protein n=1 Tax=Lunatimonas salinarum TaxID=1774590 RepID=UPI001ADFA78A|nr:T9SS type A sorting domain-containing protein [Lunatimonas salinarum]
MDTVKNHYSRGCSFFVFTVYPNPASEAIHVRMEGESRKVPTDNPGYYTKGMHDENGNPVWEKETDSQEEHIPTTGWKEGIYHVRLHHPEGNFAQKVIVRH